MQVPVHSEQSSKSSSIEPSPPPPPATTREQPPRRRSVVKVVVKPRWTTGSRGAFQTHNKRYYRRHLSGNLAKGDEDRRLEKVFVGFEVKAEGKKIGFVRVCLKAAVVHCGHCLASFWWFSTEAFEWTLGCCGGSGGGGRRQAFLWDLSALPDF